MICAAPLLTESRAGFRLRTDAADAAQSCQLHLRGGSHPGCSVGRRRYRCGRRRDGEAERDPSDRHLWAVVKDMAAQLPASDAVAKALAAVTRNASTIGSMVNRQAATADIQLTLADELIMRSRPWPRRR